MKKTKDKALETKMGIYDAALKVFSSKGFSATTLEDIAKEAGISRGAIYWNFKNKQDLYVQLLREQFLGKMSDHFEFQVNRSNTVQVNLKNYIYSYFNRLFKEEQFRQFIEMIRYKTEVKSDIQEVLMVQQEIDMTIRNDIYNILLIGIDKKEIIPKYQPDSITMFILSLINGLEDTWLLSPESFSLTEKLDDIIELSFHGFIVSP